METYKKNRSRMFDITYGYVLSYFYYACNDAIIIHFAPG